MLKNVFFTLTAVALAAAPLGAQMAADAVFQGLQPTGDFIFELGGEEVENAEIFHSERAVAYLIIAPALRSPLLVSPRTGAVESVQLMKISRQADGSVDLLADASFGRVGPFRIDGESVVFEIDGETAKLKPRPWLLGEQSTESVKSSNPDYARRAAGYKLNQAAIEALQTEERDVRVRVFFGSWCPFCKQHVPFIVRVAEELSDSNITFDYYGLPRPFDGDVEAKRADVHSVPTGIVYVDGKEVGRLNGRDWQSPEAALNRLLRGA